ncbi:unnamed protein product [Brassicogethes aeneus]|uniref:CIDE-N domain-containing protein n=1 Tax=Brassicogethes aeneus TaxID=1431903 RepID=A0A9P0BHE2_BRAAE|nr:unnamed protein product [Brassicogethes aeneus]
MAALTFFKIWSLRGNKGVIYLTQAENMLLNLIVKASEKFNINGAKLVLQKDGTDIDDDIILEHFKDEVLLLLKTGQFWDGGLDGILTLNDNRSTTTSTSTASTASVTLVNDYEDTDSIIEVPAKAPLGGEVMESSEDSTITLTIDCNSNVLWKLFEVPWEILPKNIYDACDKGKVKDHQAKTFVIQTVVHKMREIKDHIPASAIHIIAQKIIDKFPVMFKDIDEDGIVIGDGSHTLFRKIQDRNNYLNRQKKPKDQESAIKNKKRRVAERAGCTLWSPNIDDEYEPQEMLNCTDPQLKDKINKCLAQQRNFILEDPKVDATKTEWPILLTKEGTFCHFKKLTSSNAKSFMTAITEKYEKFKKLAVLSKYELD